MSTPTQKEIDSARTWLESNREHANDLRRRAQSIRELVNVTVGKRSQAARKAAATRLENRATTIDKMVKPTADFLSTRESIA